MTLTLLIYIESKTQKGTLLIEISKKDFTLYNKGEIACQYIWVYYICGYNPNIKDTIMSNEININGKMYSGKNISVVNNVVTIDGKVQSSKEEYLNIIVTGDITTLYCTTVTVNGNVGEIDCTSLKCGDVTGNVDATNVTCGNITGNVDAVNVVRR